MRDETENILLKYYTFYDLLKSNYIDSIYTIK